MTGYLEILAAIAEQKKKKPRLIRLRFVSVPALFDTFYSI